MRQFLLAMMANFMVIYVIDGDASDKRTIHIQDVDTEKHRFYIALYDIDETGYEYMVERHLVGVDEDDKDDMGVPAYIETVLETRSKRLRCDYLEGTKWEAIEKVLLELEDKKATPSSFAFKGGTTGGEPTIDDWLKGVECLRRESMPLNLLFAAGNYDPDVIARMSEIADFRHCSFFFDVPPYLPPDSALEWIKDLGLKSRHTRAYHSPYSANDPWRGARPFGAYPAQWQRQKPVETPISRKMFQVFIIAQPAPSAVIWPGRAWLRCSRMKAPTVIQW